MTSKPKDYLDAPLNDSTYEESDYLLKDARKNKSKLKNKPKVSKKETKLTLKEIQRKINDKRIDLSIAKDKKLTTTVKDLERQIKSLTTKKQNMNKSKQIKPVELKTGGSIIKKGNFTKRGPCK